MNLMNVGYYITCFTNEATSMTSIGNKWNSVDCAITIIFPDHNNSVRTISNYVLKNHLLSYQQCLSYASRIYSNSNYFIPTIDSY